MGVEGWKEVSLGDVINFNPKLTIKKGTVAKKITMQDLNPFERKISRWTKEVVAGGARFENGDTLLARITPCLENGKTAFVDVLEQGEIGFGSTEFIVLRAKSKITDPKYVYYLSISPEFRHIAIQSMTGSSGRQRVQLDVLKNTKIKMPSIEEQVRIANILSAFDDKIEINNQINQNLESMAQAIFRSWFVDFEPFRDGEFVESELGMIPKGWEIINVADLIDQLIGGDWGKEKPEKNYVVQVHCARGADIQEIVKGNKGKVPTRYILEKNFRKKISVVGDIIVEISGGSPTQSTGRVALVTEELLERFSSRLICTNFCRLLRPKNDLYSFYLYYYFKYLYAKEVFFQFENGTTGIKNLDISGFLKNFKIVLPPESTLTSFNSLVNSKLKMIQMNGQQSESLSTLRDTLLPKLMSGEIRV
jgi:type I restriction enzyme, S subunit